MALDALVDSAKLNACLDAEADAIRAKTSGSSELPFDYANDKGFADAIAAIPSGGGAELPSIISALAGGSFTLSVSAKCNTQQIQHGMTAVPKGFFIWSDDAFTETDTGDTTVYFESGYFSNLDTQNASGAVAGYFVSQCYRQSDKRLSVNNGAKRSAQISSFVNATSICMNTGDSSFQAGKTYKWLAWA